MAGSLADPGPILGRAAANAAAVKLIVVFLHLIESAAGSARDTSHPARPTSSLTSDGIAALRLSVERIQATRCGSVELDALITEVLRCAFASTSATPPVRAIASWGARAGRPTPTPRLPC